MGDLHRISEAFAALLANLFTFVKSGHPACPFITQKQLALYASPRFWQYGLLAFIARCCSFDNQHRHQGTGTAQAVAVKPQKTKEKDVDVLTFMQTVIMSFVRGMEYGEQTLPTNDLFVYLPATDPKKKELQTTLYSLWECILKKFLTTDAPECRIRPGLKELTLVVPLTFFFHEYGRRVGMVPRSSLKEGKYNQMVEKRTKTTQQQTKQNQPQPTGRDSTTK